MQKADHLWMAILDDRGFGRTSEQLDLHFGPTSQTTAIEVAEEPLRHLVPYLPKHVIVVLDRGYDAVSKK